MRYLALIPLFVLALIPNSQPTQLDTSKAEKLVPSFFVAEKQEFPDRSKQISEAKQLDAQRAENARLEAERIRLAELAKNVPQTLQIAQNTHVGASDDAFIKLSYCEAGGVPNKNTGNGYYGMFQYDIRTWANYGGYARADLAPAEVQLAKAKETQARRGWSPWPSCARKLGLL